MSEETTVVLREMVGSEYCVASSDGERVYGTIRAALGGGQNVVLSFRNVALLTSAFLNAAIGRLYGDFTEEELRDRVREVDMSLEDEALLQRVIATAKAYFKNPDRFKQLHIGGEDADE